ncbi:MAG: prepilin-type N-terminal cleavage/methylation domain-containing protein, partial [Thermoguttaceae bacterium]|nr:prepilin-type N-terminal cleavage/methylation domain-containing protein [Thermoguttaceae bacterium]
MRVLTPSPPFGRDRFGTLAKNGETWERRAAVERLNVAANSSTNAGTSGGQASNQLPFSVDRAFFAGRRRAVPQPFYVERRDFGSRVDSATERNKTMTKSLFFRRSNALSPRRGFTLLEILTSITLALTLMYAVAR